MKPVKGALTAVLTIAILTLFLAACGQPDPTPPSDTPAPTSATQPASSAADSTPQPPATPGQPDRQPGNTPASTNQPSGQPQPSPGATTAPPAPLGQTPSPTIPSASTPPPQAAKDPTSTPETGGICDRHPSLRQAILDQLPGHTCSQVDQNALEGITAIEGLHLPTLPPDYTEDMPNLEYIQVTLENPNLTVSHLPKLERLAITLQVPSHITDQDQISYIIDPDRLDPRDPFGLFQSLPFRSSTAADPVNRPNTDPDSREKLPFTSVTLTFPIPEPGSLHINTLALAGLFITKSLNIVDHRPGCPALGTLPYLRNTIDYAGINCHATGESRIPIIDLTEFNSDTLKPHLYYPETLEVNNLYTEDHIYIPDNWLNQNYPYITDITLTGRLEFSSEILKRAKHLDKVTIDHHTDPGGYTPKLSFPEGHLPDLIGIDAYR